jgi:uncharacterized protein YndB with AHSA1/START domain
MSKATLVTDRAHPAVRLERLLPDPPHIVWRALTDREELRSWFPCDVIVEGGRWQVGAPLTFPFPPEVIDMTLTGEVRELDEPHVLEYTWGGEILRFELTPEGDGTRLALIDELQASAAARNAAGWETCLDRLEGREPAGDVWQSRFDVYAASFEPSLDAQDGPPAGYKGGDAEA